VTRAAHGTGGATRPPSTTRSNAVQKSHSGSHAGASGHYRRFALMVVLMFVAMYALMYAMVDRLAHVFNNVNQLWMAALMTGAMVLVELALMGSMYPNRRVNIGIAVAAVLALVLGWIGIREQWLVDDRQFLRSMIPHHAGAILMCEEARLSEPRIAALCRDIVVAQRREIAQMRALLQEAR
jgi:hypothetical protein